MGCEVKNPGLATTVQDRGRLGYYNVGIPQGGAMDQYSAEIANTLVGNTPEHAVLECTYLGPFLRFTEATIIAITGAPVPVMINGEEQPEWTHLRLGPGDELSFGPLRGGARFYIAMAGGIDVPVILGSRSTYVLGGIGGLNGRKLEMGDIVPIGKPRGEPSALESLPDEFRPLFTKEQTVRVVMGLYDHLLTAAGRESLLTSDWKVTTVADRMGIRYSGPGVEWKEREQPFGAGSDPSNIVDSGYAVGSIQIPGGTQPIVLHCDAVSGGGYAMVATVISTDMDLLSRAAPGTVTRFVEVSLEEALEARKEKQVFIDRAVTALCGK